MLLMFAEPIRKGMCQATYRYAKANNKYMKNHDKNKESSYLQYLDANNLYGWAMSQKLPVGDFKQVDDLSIFNEDFKKIMMKRVIQDTYLQQMQNIQKIFISYIVIYPFYLKE